MHFIKSNKEVLEAPGGWVWHDQLKITLPTGNDCLFVHGYKSNTFIAAKEQGCSLVSGHFHSKQELIFWGKEENPFFAMIPGCLIDNRSLAFEYNKTTAKNVRLGAAMIVNGIPFIIPMLLDKDGRWLGKK